MEFEIKDTKVFTDKGEYVGEFWWGQKPYSSIGLNCASKYAMYENELYALACEFFDGNGLYSDDGPIINFGLKETFDGAILRSLYDIKISDAPAYMNIKRKVMDLLRKHKATGPRAYNCILEEPDSRVKLSILEELEKEGLSSKDSYNKIATVVSKFSNVFKV